MPNLDAKISPRAAGRHAAFTLLELLMAALLLVIVSFAMLREFTARNVLNEHGRALSWATIDADRVMEELRRQNVGCGVPSTAPPPNLPGPNFASWDAWLADASANGGGGKSLQTMGGMGEVVQVQTGGGPDPLQVTVAVCWVHRGRAIGDCNLAGGISSPAMLSTTVTCR